MPPTHEEAALRRIRRLPTSPVDACFAMRRQVMYRSQGVWALQEQLMFPGYVFLAATEPEAVSRAFRHQGLAALAAQPLVLLTRAQTELLQGLGGPDHLVPFSRGRIVDGRLVVDEGPLGRYAHLVAKIDRHKRCAYLSQGCLGEVNLRVGLEVVSKT